MNLLRAAYPVALLFLAAVSAGATTLEVPREYRTIQGAIDAASDGDTVLVRPGVYRENLDFSGKRVVVGSEFILTGDETAARQTVIDGSGSGHVVVFSSGEGRSSTLAGFTVCNGRVYRGGGVYCDDAGPTLSHLIIVNNRADEDGGGIACWNSSSPLVEDCVVHDNSADGQGGGIYGRYGSSPLLRRVDITANSAGSGGGVYLRDGCCPELEEVTISGNSAASLGGGLVLNLDCHARLRRVAITDNSAENLYAGGVFIGRSRPVLENVTVAGNRTGGDGGGLFLMGSSVAVAWNSILWGNQPDEAHFRGSPTPPGSITVGYSDVCGGEDGVVIPGNAHLIWERGNIDADPLFLGAGDYRLTAGSPCIDAGDPDSWPDPDGSRVDMGAFPFEPGGVDGDGDGRCVPAEFSIVSVFPNPFNAQVTFELSLPYGGDPLLSIYDLGGRRIGGLEIPIQGRGVNRVRLDAADWPAGVYVARLMAAGSGDAVTVVCVK